MTLREVSTIRSFAGLAVAAVCVTALVPSAPNAGKTVARSARSDAVMRTMAGSVSGTVTFTGTPPKMHAIDMTKEASCAKEHAANPVLTETVVTGPNNALQYVVVYVTAGDMGTASTQTVKFDQHGCQYLPHILAMHAGQPLEIANDDQTSHNIHPLPSKNPEWNKSQPPGAPPIQTKYDNPEFIPVKCNIHPWMHGYFAVLNTGHFAVTANDGSYTITGLPPGKYTLTAWQEKFGTQTADITISGSETAKANFVFKATPY